MKENNCDCFLCKNDHSFELSEELIKSFINDDVVLFAGAGISTESSSVLHFTLYDEIQNELDTIDNSLSFPELMENFCNLPNGRLKFLEKIKKRFQYIDSFPELNRMATRFHNELATFYPLKTIITTNWDNYFEDCCNATPFVTDKDLAFWESSDRKVLKIHGSINNYGSIIASSSDYKLCEESLNSGILGSKLKSLLATKTIVFIGYSLSDSDFNNIYGFVLNQMQELHKQAYIVSPYNDGAKRYKDLGLIPIITDGTYFLNQLKQHAIQSNILLSDDIYTNILSSLLVLEEEHYKLSSEINIKDYPQVMFALSYQDGMRHLFERALNFRKSGEYSHKCNLIGLIQLYNKMRKEKLRDKIYEDVAYIEGYSNALLFIACNDKLNFEDIPLYFSFGKKEDLFSLSDYKKILSKGEKVHKASFKRALNYLSSLKKPQDVTFHHPAWL